VTTAVAVQTARNNDVETEQRGEREK